MKTIRRLARIIPVLVLSMMIPTIVPAAQAGVQHEDVGILLEGIPVSIYTLTNSHGMMAKVTNFGAVVTELHVPDREGQLADVVLGFDQIHQYWNDRSPSFGCIVGRYGNRIANGRFELDGKTYWLATNIWPHHLHGGLKGFSKLPWRGEPVSEAGRVGVALTHHSIDGEEGYPGALTVRVTYWLTDDNEMRIDYEAVTDKPTVLNLTHHGYFNLKGYGEGDITDHELMIAADAITPVDPLKIPTGEIMPVDGTPFDFRTPRVIATSVNDPHPQVAISGGYDHNFVLSGRERRDDGLALAARVSEPRSGRVMEVWTDQPGMQFFTANMLDGTIIGKGGKPVVHRAGLALETQHFPDSPNQPDFPSTVLRPGETFRSSTSYRFTVSR